MKKGVLRDGTKLENTLDRQFDQQVPDKVFATDVTYIATTKGCLYVSPIIDLCTREIVACEMSMTQDLSLAFRTIDGLHKAVKGSLVLHSDQGSLYTSTVFRAHAFSGAPVIRPRSCRRRLAPFVRLDLLVSSVQVVSFKDGL